jgi:Leucine-rich repeat (LRR) protein
MISSIQKNAHNCIGWCQFETAKLKPSLLLKKSLFEIIRSISFLFSIILPFIGLIANCLTNRTLNLAHKQLSQIDVSAESYLQELEIYDNNLSEAPNLSGNPNLRVLNMSRNNLNSIVIPNLANLTKVCLATNKLEHAYFAHLPSLEKLDIQGNNFFYLSESIIQLPRTCVVDARHNYFSPEYIDQLKAGLENEREINSSCGPTILVTNTRNPTNENDHLEL